MLTRVGKTRLSAVAQVALLLSLIALTLASLGPVARADPPIKTQNGDASRTLTWYMNTTDALSADNVSVGGGRAVLSWQSAALSWTTANETLANGTASPNVVADAAGVGLWANRSNYLADPGFGTSGPWDYLNDTRDNASASWNGSLQAAGFDSRSPSTESLWDSLDAPTATLNWSATPGGAVFQNGSSNPPPKQGTGTMGLEVLNAQASVGAIRQSIGPLNWSAYDRLVLWVYLNVSLSVSFNVTAHYGMATPLLTTPAQALAKGWQEVVVNLSQLGGPRTRSNLTSVTLRFTSPNPMPVGTWFDLDDLRLGSAKVFDAAASVSQLVFKANGTTPFPGSGVLSFDWCFLTVDGADAASIEVTVGTGASPPFSAALAPIADGLWQTSVLDVSSATTSGGTYNMTLGLRVSVNTTAATDVELRIDNASLTFPEVANGTFVSNALTIGTGSEFTTLQWSGSAAGGTSIDVSLRTGNNTAPGSGTWSDWETSTVPAFPVNLDVPPASHFQIRIDLNTTDASLSPVFQGLVLQTLHRAAGGNLSSGVQTAESDFLRWRSFNATTAGAASSLEFYLWNGTWEAPVSANANLSAYTGGPTIRWRVHFTTSDGVQSPALLVVKLTYEYLGPVVRIRISPHSPTNATVGQWVYLQAGAYDAGGHPVTSLSSAFSWSGGDPTGHLYSNGSYLPNEPGNWSVTATLTVNGLVYTDTVIVDVRPADTGKISGWTAAMAFMPYLLAVLAAAGIGFVVYEVAIRRMFSVDDVFVIARDGRLMMHNTRRMRADRDEDVLSGMLTAMIAFLKDWDPEENGKAKRFDYGDKTALLEHGERVYVAAVYSGRIPRWAAKDLARFVRDLEAHFGESFARWSGDPQDLHGLREFVGRFVTHTRYHGNGNGNGHADGKPA